MQGSRQSRGIFRGTDQDNRARLFAVFATTLIDEHRWSDGAESKNMTGDWRFANERGSTRFKYFYWYRLGRRDSGVVSLHRRTNELSKWLNIQATKDWRGTMLH